MYRACWSNRVRGSRSTAVTPRCVAEGDQVKFCIFADESADRQLLAKRKQRGLFIASLAFDRGHVTRDRCFQHGFAVLRDGALEVMTVTRLERERLKCCVEVPDRTCP